MAINPEQIDRLLSMTEKNREVEIACRQSLDQLDSFVQSGAAGVPIEGVLERVGEHLKDCLCCSVQLGLVRDRLKAMED